MLALGAITATCAVVTNVSPRQPVRIRRTKPVTESRRSMRRLVPAAWRLNQGQLWLTRSMLRLTSVGLV